MTPQALVLTALLLGLFVLAGGAYGSLYAAGRLCASDTLRRAGFAFYGAQALLVAAVWLTTPLFLGWKVFVALSCLAYGFIPPVTLNYLERLHEPRRGAA
jgi:hypothetical protein